MPKPRPLAEIAAAIDAHLKRFEADPEINQRRSNKGTKRYWNASSRRAGSYVAVTYISYQGARTLTRAEAESYLSWLDAGNAGTHADALQTTKEETDE